MFDYKNPDYIGVFDTRIKRLKKIRENPQVLAGLFSYYRNNPADFINDWGITFDPRKTADSLPAFIPFILFDKQIEAVNWVMDYWKNKKNGLLEKTRETGASWLTVALAVTLCLFNTGVVIGFGSRKEEYVDSRSNPKSLLYKARLFLNYLPQEFKQGWNENRNSAFKIINFPATQSKITGEAGDNLGRGDRTSIYFVDEAAFLERPLLVDAALSQTTTCRIDVSTPQGMNNPFAQKRFSGKIGVFTMRWQDDPRKSYEWYQRECERIIDPVIIAQELDLDYSASIEGLLIEAKWVQAAIDAHIKLKLIPSGEKTAALDVADEGKDLNAMIGRHGILIENASFWSGKNSDIFTTTENAFKFCDINNYNLLRYDADGLGAGVKGDAKQINEKRKIPIKIVPFRGSGEVVNPEKEVYPDKNKIASSVSRTNGDFFYNAKAQSWWELRKRFQKTYQKVVENRDVDENEIISISSTIPHLNKIAVELSQPTFSANQNGKITVDKNPDGAASPNLADAVMMAFAIMKKPSRGILDYL